MTIKSPDVNKKVGTFVVKNNLVKTVDETNLFPIRPSGTIRRLKIPTTTYQNRVPLCIS